MKKQTSTISQIGAIHTLLAKCGLKDEKKSIVSSFTAGRTTSTKEMRFGEAAALIGHLKAMSPEDSASDRMKFKILSMAHEMNWRKPGTFEIDMAHVNNWMRSMSYLKKELDQYKYAELPKLVSQFEEVYKSFIRQ